MIVPFDFSRRQLEEREKLEYDSVNVGDLIDISLGEEQDKNIEDLSLTLWDSRKFDVQINFKDPLAVVAGDAAIFELKYPFVSAESGLPIP